MYFDNEQYILYEICEKDLIIKQKFKRKNISIIFFDFDKVLK